VWPKKKKKEEEERNMDNEHRQEGTEGFHSELSSKVLRSE